MAQNDIISGLSVSQINISTVVVSIISQAAPANMHTTYVKVDRFAPTLLVQLL